MRRTMDLIPYQSHGETMDLETCINAWLHAKAGRSGSQQTLSAYRETLFQFRALLQEHQRDLDSDPGIVAPLAQGWAGTTKSKKRTGVTPATSNQRLAILSSFYAYAIKHEVLLYNPHERVERHAA